ncbi:MAG: hypothetical protein PHF72_08795 [Gammaproteobacteria bacterium]|nr:hypothetical protein [Gammaproteobacteria bacterium]
MNLLRNAAFLLRISRSHGILRRYFVVNGFDGALAMLGLMTGFLVSGEVGLEVVIRACLGAAVALFMSGITSAYVSESAERRRALDELEGAMVADLRHSAHADAARWVPLLVAAVNGLAPLLVALLVMTPLWLADAGVPLPLPPLPAAVAMAFLVLFGLGLFLGRVSGGFWLWSGLRTLLVGVATALIILLFIH